MRPRTLTATALTALLLAVAGCSSHSTGSTPTANGAPNANGAATGSGGNAGSNPATLPECPTSAAVSAAFGIAYGDLAQNSTAKERNCSYAPSSPETGIASLSFQILPGAGDFIGVKAGYSAGRTVTSIDGLGDEAFSSVLNAGPSPKNTVAARKGLLLVLVSSFATVDKETAFIKPLLG